MWSITAKQLEEKTQSASPCLLKDKTLPHTARSVWSIIGSSRCGVTHSNEKHLEVSRTRSTSLKKFGWGLITALGVSVLKSFMLTFTCRWYMWSYLCFTQRKHKFAVATWMRYLPSFQKQSGSWAYLSLHHSLYRWCHLSLADEETFNWVFNI